MITNIKKFKLFLESINESSNSNFSQTVLTALEPTIAQMTETIKNKIIKMYADKNINYKFTKYDEENVRLGLIIDMLKSFEKYTEPTDKLVSIRPQSGAKGIEIYAKIERDGQIYDYYTDAIGAGGYNIQSFHYRYITKTKLPNARVKSTLALEYIEKQKKLSKVEKINNEINYIERDIEKINNNLAEVENVTDQDIAKMLKDEGHYSHNNPSWEQIIKNDAARNYNNSEAEYLASVEKTERHGIDFWKKQNIQWPTDRRKSLEKQLVKLRSKLDLAINL